MKTLTMVRQSPESPPAADDRGTIDRLFRRCREHVAEHDLREAAQALGVEESLLDAVYSAVPVPDERGQALVPLRATCDGPAVGVARIGGALELVHGSPGLLLSNDYDIPRWAVVRGLGDALRVQQVDLGRTLEVIGVPLAIDSAGVIDLLVDFMQAGDPPAEIVVYDPSDTWKIEGELLGIGVDRAGRLRLPATLRDWIRAGNVSLDSVTEWRTR